MVVNTDTFIADAIFFVKDQIDSNITDPISSTRPSGQKFVLTSYPKEPVSFPIVTVVDDGIEDVKLGQGSEQRQVFITVEVRMWARNVKERDELAQDIYNQFRSTELDESTGSAANNLHDVGIQPMRNVDDGGERGIKSKVLPLRYYMMIGT